MPNGIAMISPNSVATTTGNSVNPISRATPKIAALTATTSSSRAVA
ncbi:Uncharacterised protein [Mycobacterium tuberculosis]|nr:hypothetical protein CAB90_00607 [Mycobacterium tuberculosis]CFE46711.1 Uncharacterised protein [Mycobacterium tuberculosis]CKU23518.1 Uncharacterised protein [Mycobacterium tuberculosis]CNW19529.1 Uncharacterised protein [Mycobacterium tuberculosis]